MSTVKISQLPAASSPVSPSDVLPVVQGGVTKKASIDKLGFVAAGTDAANRTIQNKARDIVSVKDFGAVGDGVTDDTMALFNCFGYVNDVGGNCGVYFPKGTYLIGTVNLNNVPADGAWRSAIKAATSGYGSQCQIVLYGVDNVSVSGDGVIKTKDSGTPTTSLLAYASIFFLKNCSYVYFDGIRIDGNRNNQLNTLNQNFGHNEAITLDYDCSDIYVQNCYIENTGSLRTGTDKRGEALYFANGASNIYFRNNIVKNMGRWGVVLEAGAGNSKNIVIEGNTYFGALRGVTPPSPNDWCSDCLGFVDIEHFQDHSDIFIRENIIYKSGVISFGGSDAGVATCNVTNVVIEGNTWNGQEVSGNDGYERIVNAGSSSPGTLKTYKNFIFRNNKVYYGSQALGKVSQNRILNLEYSVFQNVFIEDNYINQYCGAVTGGDEAGMSFYSCKLLDEIRYARNVIVNSAARAGWFGLRLDSGSSNYNMFLIDNDLTNGHRGVWFDQGAGSTANLYCVNNKIVSTLSKTSDLVQGQTGNFFVYVSDLPLNANPQLTSLATFKQYVTSTTQKKIGSIQTKNITSTGSTVIFRIKLTTTRPGVSGTLIMTEYNYDQNAAIMQINYLHYGGVWYAATPAVIYDTAAGPAPTITINGNYLDIAWQKNSGGPDPALLTYDLNMVNCDIEVPT